MISASSLVGSSRVDVQAHGRSRACEAKQLMSMEWWCEDLGADVCPHIIEVVGRGVECGGDAHSVGGGVRGTVDAGGGGDEEDDDDSGGDGGCVLAAIVLQVTVGILLARMVVTAAW